MSFFEKLKNGLIKTKNAFLAKIDDVLKHFVRIDEDFFDELEEILITADIGVGTAEYILDELRERVRDSRNTDAENVKKLLMDALV